MSRRFWATLPTLLALAVLQPSSAGVYPRASFGERGAAPDTRSEAPVREVPAQALAPEATSRVLPPAPFGPAATSRLSLAVTVVAASLPTLVTRAPASTPVGLPRSRAPPAHS
jgi:hypothetical protein